MSLKSNDFEFVQPMLSSKKDKKVYAFNSPNDVEVIEPGSLGDGHSYQYYCREWIRWLVSNNPESNNYGPVHFLHCVSCQDESSTYGSGYGNQPVVRIGSQALNINAGEYVFMPVLTSAADAIDTPVYDSPTALLNYVRTDLEGGDNPPHPYQATIVDATETNDKNRLIPIVDDLSRYLVISDIFTLDVPPAQEGSRLLRTCFDVPINTEGPRNCCVGGWWLLLRFKTAGRRYYIHGFSKGRAQYLAGMLHEINVLGESVRSRITAIEPKEDWSKSAIVNFARKLKNNGELDGKHTRFIQRILTDL